MHEHSMALMTVLLCMRRIDKGKTPFSVNKHVLSLCRYKHMGETAVRMRTQRFSFCPTGPLGRTGSPGSPCSRRCSSS